MNIELKVEDFKHKKELKDEILKEICPPEEEGKYKLNYCSRLNDYIILEKLNEIQPGQYIRYFLKNDKCRFGCKLKNGGIVLDIKERKDGDGKNLILKIPTGKSWSKVKTIKLNDCLYIFRKKTKVDKILEVYMSLTQNTVNITLDSDNETETETETEK